MELGTHVHCIELSGVLENLGSSFVAVSEFFRNACLRGAVSYAEIRLAVDRQYEEGGVITNVFYSLSDLEF